MFQRYLRAAFGVCAGVLMLNGCTCGNATNVANSKVPERCEDAPQTINPQKTDILFVIDDSGSMTEEQAGVAQELPAFVQTLLTGGGGIAQDFQAGVITTSVYENVQLPPPYGVQFHPYPAESGRLQAVPELYPDGGAGGITTEKVLKSTDPQIVPKFAALVKQGTHGSGQETPFEAVRLATSDGLTQLAQSFGGNQGFFRDGARLLVVVVSDEDDCSESDRPPGVAMGGDDGYDYCTHQAAKLRPVGDYYSDFQHLVDSTGTRREVLWAAIAPVSVNDKSALEVTDTINGKSIEHNVDCPTSNGPGYRQRQMAELFDNQLQNLDSICRPSYHDTLVNIAKLAAVSQTVEMSQNVPDPGLLVVNVTRAAGNVQKCTVQNGGILFEAATSKNPARLHFTGSCLHRQDDKQIQVLMLCAS